MNIITDIESLINSDEFDGCQFEKLNLAGSSLLNSKYFFSSVFIDCDLSNCEIYESTFRDCKFINCNLSLSKFTDTNFSDITLTSCKLIGIDWTALERENRHPKKRKKFSITFQNSILDYSVFIGMNLYSASFIDSTLKEVSFENANLESANFKNTDLIGSSFRDTILLKADFSTAINYTINASINQVKGAKFSLPEAITLIHALEIEIV